MSPIKTIPTENVTPQLIEKIHDIEEQCFESTIAWGIPILSYILRNKKHQLIVAEDEKRSIQGYCIFSRDSNVNRIHIQSIAVHPNAQKQGYAFLMMQEALRLASQKSQTPWSISLECRPANEDYYKNIGFKVTAPPQKNYYTVLNHHLPAIAMQANSLFRTEKKPPAAICIPKNPKDVALLLDFVSELKANTSFWYRAFFHSARKEKALEAIQLELLAHQNTQKILSQEQYERILRAIVSNALMIRCQWRSGTSHTRSAEKALLCLQSEKYASLAQIITPDMKSIDYDQLVAFAGFNKKADRRAALAKDYPYTHFFKRKTSTEGNRPIKMLGINWQ